MLSVADKIRIKNIYKNSIELTKYLYDGLLKLKKVKIFNSLIWVKLLPKN